MVFNRSLFVWRGILVARMTRRAGLGAAMEPRWGLPPRRIMEQMLDLRRPETSLSLSKVWAPIGFFLFFFLMLTQRQRNSRGSRMLTSGRSRGSAVSKNWADLPFPGDPGERIWTLALVLPTVVFPTVTRVRNTSIRSLDASDSTIKRPSHWSVPIPSAVATLTGPASMDPGTSAPPFSPTNSSGSCWVKSGLRKSGMVLSSGPITRPSRWWCCRRTWRSRRTAVSRSMLNYMPRIKTFSSRISPRSLVSCWSLVFPSRTRLKIGLYSRDRRSRVTPSACLPACFASLFGWSVFFFFFFFFFCGIIFNLCV